MPFWKSDAFLTRFWRLLFGQCVVLPTQSRRQRSFAVEPLEDRQLLAVDSGLNVLALSALDPLAAIFPQPREYYVNSQATASTIDVADATSASLATALAESGYSANVVDNPVFDQNPSSNLNNWLSDDELSDDVGVSYSLGGVSLTLENELPQARLSESPTQEINGMYLSLDDMLGDAVQSELSATSNISTLQKARVYGPMTYAEHLASLPPGGLNDSDDGGMVMMACGCGGNCGCGNPYTELWLSGSNTSEIVYACACGGGSTSTELFTFQEDSQGCSFAQISISATTYTGCVTNAKGWIMVNDPVLNPLYPNQTEYWSCSSSSFTWSKPANKTNAQCRRDFTITVMVYVDANGDNQYNPGEQVLSSTSLNVYIGYAEVKTVEFTGDHDVLRTNWKQENGQWVWDNTYTYQGTQFSGPEWDATRKTNTGQYVSFGASYTKGSKVSVKATMEVDSRGRDFKVSGCGGQYMNFPATPWVNIQGSGVFTSTSLSALPSSVATVNSSILWFVSTATSGTNAGTSGNHTIFVTMGTPIQNYTTDDGTTYENKTTEKRLADSCATMNGATTVPQAAAMIASTIGHNGVQQMSFNWYAWGYLQNSTSPGDCGTLAAVAVASLRQIGIAAQHDLAYATSDTDASAMERTFFDLWDSKGNLLGTFRAKLVFTGNNYEAFFTVPVENGETWGYTGYPINGPFKSNNLHLEIIKAAIGTTNTQFWVWDGNQTINGVTVNDWGIVPGQPNVPLPK